jgi:SAM-dependent methyltransferase
MRYFVPGDALMENLLSQAQTERLKNMYQPQDFKRRDESQDPLYYATGRMVSHLDAQALATVERIIGTLIVEEHPQLLDLMASWDSHLPEGLKPAHLTGLGMNRHELEANRALNGFVVHDLNQDPHLPFEDGAFDGVLNVVSVDYLTKPWSVFREVARVLKPWGLFLIIFSNRWFEDKVTRIWRRSGENERFSLVDDWLAIAGGFGPSRKFVSKGLPRPKDDKYAHLGIPSDPVYALWAEKIGHNHPQPARPYPKAPQLSQTAHNPGGKIRMSSLGPICPHCGEVLRKWQVPQTPFTQWDNEYMYVCFNDQCPYLLRGFESMGRQGNLGSSYRLMYNPVNGSCGPILVQNLNMLKDGIMD